MFKLFKEEIDCHTRRLFHTIDIHVKVGEAKVQKAFVANEVITEVFVSNEEMSTNIVKEAFDEVKFRERFDIIGDDVGKSNSKKDCDIVGDHFGKSNSEKDYEIVRCGVEKSNSENDYDIVSDDVGKSNSKKNYDIVRDVVGKSYNEKVGDILVHEDMDIPNFDFYTHLKAQPRKHLKNVSLRTLWRRLDRKNRRPIE
ncbi:uncharacterized protein HKW66_Vig0240430 [Vigna angularis]|uniref:Uncharacterized protein n=1 Tax=Phaseolus angularis TaxID=3914 RepID=A0A8T0JFF1_PHAAN|nr:uncharacterized protein HKW66_Vig0240430 [Vigna angularis]